MLLSLHLAVLAGYVMAAMGLPWSHQASTDQPARPADLRNPGRATVLRKAGLAVFVWKVWDGWRWLAMEAAKEPPS